MTEINSYVNACLSITPLSSNVVSERNQSRCCYTGVSVTVYQDCGEISPSRLRDVCVSVSSRPSHFPDYCSIAPFSFPACQKNYLPFFCVAWILKSYMKETWKHFCFLSITHTLIRSTQLQFCSIFSPPCHSRDPLQCHQFLSPSVGQPLVWEPLV